MTIEASRADTAAGRIRLGMVGGGQGAFIGAVHRIASRIDDRFELVAGALSSDPERARASAADLGIDPARAYGSFAEMAEAEAARPDGIEVVSIVTPNHMHVPAAKAFLQAGIHVICDKPLSISLSEGEELAALLKGSDRLFVLTHNYTGYPMIREARARIRAGELGELRLVQAEYPQEWLAEATETQGSKQAEWRTDPARSGAGGCIGDIGTHAFNLASFVTGQEPSELLAQLTTFVPGRRLDDDVQILLRYSGGMRGMLWASQVAVGHENGLKLRVYGTKGGLEWTQADPNYLWVSRLGEPKQLVTRNGAGSGPDSRRVSRIPSGHPEGYLEGFANVYTEAADAIVAARKGERSPSADLPGIEAGLAGMQFIETAVRSSRNGCTWEPLGGSGA
ncbi:Gfo/Idh/MocA family protein [Aureimonas psammosilenae]|uniref:Gfo/Idh/MocA family protein n=1 Tax=Aureimonas psammosilenae TaxID=2495496 RepID=UPI001260F1DC|nr:Gfo/Idh/MocA family oxidoreductase [Aureimonas psammosilenae]